MAKIIIKNIGPIKDAQFDLNKINVFMGPQSSGKSTIAKIISYCTWVEKDVATSQSLETYQNNKTYFKNHIVNFHKIKGYFRPESFLLYKSDVVEIKWEDQESVIKWVDQYAYKRSKISYIPSERNMIILPDVKKVEFGNTNIRSFLFDWFDARKNYPKEKKLSILDLHVDYYFSESNINEEDHIKGLNDMSEYDILLSNASSGLQSLTPLIAMIDYLTKWIYIQETDTSYDQEQKQTKTKLKLLEELILKPMFNISSTITKELFIESQNKFVELVNSKDKKALEYLNNWGEINNDLFVTRNTVLIIEEPEQNLFPSTQKELIYHILNKVNDKEKDHKLTITTHSPYILYALNNCMMGGLVYEKMSEEDKNKLGCINSIINPNLVSVYEIHNGILRTIQQDDKLIGANYFDKKMKELMDDFYVMINYYGND